MPFKTPDNFQPFTASAEEAKGLRPLTKEEADELGIGEKKKEKRVDKAASAIETKWFNPETKAEQEIKIDIKEKIRFFQDFYERHLNLQIDTEKVLDIWKANYTEIKEEIEKYGYDSVLIVPENLPEELTLNQKLIETMDEGVGKGQVAATQFWAEQRSIKSISGNEYKIILVHSAHNLDNHPLLKATKGKNIMNLTGLDQAEVETRISSNQELPINFETEINGQPILIQAQGLSLEAYMIQQRMYFEKTGKHLDEIGWTWLLKSSSGSRVVDADWYPGARQLHVHADDPGFADAYLGSRLSRSFLPACRQAGKLA